MSKVKTITPVATINVAQLKDDVESMLTANGFTLNDLARLEKQQEYRREYSQREHVKAKRAEYNKVRYQRQQLLKKLLAERAL